MSRRDAPIHATTPTVGNYASRRGPLRHLTPPKQGGLRASWKSFLELSPMNPALVVCMVFGFATILSFSFWWQQRAPRIGENALLVRAEKWTQRALELRRRVSSIKPFASP